MATQFNTNTELIEPSESCWIDKGDERLLAFCWSWATLIVEL